MLNLIGQTVLRQNLISKQFTHTPTEHKKSILEQKVRRITKKYLSSETHLRVT